MFVHTKRGGELFENEMFTHLVEKQLQPRMGPPLTLKKVLAESSLTLLKKIGPGLYKDFVKWGRQQKEAGRGRDIGNSVGTPKFLALKMSKVK
jgi:hypothetical protein